MRWSTGMTAALVAALLSGPLPAAAADGPAAARALGLPAATPESQGFSAPRLDALSARMHELVDGRKLAGVITLLARHGKVVHLDTYGEANAGSGRPLAPDSIFRIASMTKPITGAAMMQLYEQGKWRLDDPVAKHIPAFAHLRVKAADGTEPQRTRMTMAQLMSHSAGFAASAAYEDDDLYAGDLQDMIDKLAGLPLETQPGSAWDYGPSVNIQGYIVEKLSGQSLDEYFAEHIFEPLGMEDTGFWVPPEKADRVVAIHRYDDSGNIQTASDAVRAEKPAFLSGSGGLASTAEDYWRFAQAMANGGSLDGHRILEPETVELMYTNVLASGVGVDLYGPVAPGLGFGLDFAVLLDPEAAQTPQGANSYYWGGAFGTWFWIDPTYDLVFVGMIQNVNGTVPGAGTPPVREISIEATYDALTHPER